MKKLLMIFGLLIFIAIGIFVSTPKLPDSVSVKYSFDGTSFFDSEAKVLTCKNHEEKFITFQTNPPVKGLLLFCQARSYYSFYPEGHDLGSIWSTMDPKNWEYPKTDKNGKVTVALSPCYDNNSDGWSEDGKTVAYECSVTIPNKINSHKVWFNVTIDDDRYPVE